MTNTRNSQKDGTQFTFFFESFQFENSKESVEWEKKDHSKWGVCTQGGDNCYCAGDMNRATSQFKRGGGVVCMHNSLVNKAWKNTVTNKVLCTQKTEHPVEEKKKK